MIPTNPPIRVVVVEDSTTQRSFLRRSLEADGDIVVVGEAASALNAAAVAQHTKPDLVTMDLDIPGGGVAAISRIMAQSPIPILLLTGQPGGPRSPLAVEALAAGAVGVLMKPVRWDDRNQQLLRGRVRTLRRVVATDRHPVTAGAPPRAASKSGEGPVIALGASTGGPAALANVLRGLSGLAVPVACVQHIHAKQVDGLAGWLAKSTGWDVRVAADGDPLEPGVVSLGPGGSQLTVGEDERILLHPDPDALHAPSVDRLFVSLAAVFQARTVACLLTGMGSDGAQGMLAVRNAGGVTLVQDESTSVVYGMANAAVELGAVGRVLPLDSLPRAIERAARVLG